MQVADRAAYCLKSGQKHSRRITTASSQFCSARPSKKNYLLLQKTQRSSFSCSARDESDNSPEDEEDSRFSSPLEASHHAVISSNSLELVLERVWRGP